jgi:hypothetical protein
MMWQPAKPSGVFHVPTYRFITRRPGTLDGDLTELDFPHDEAAIEDARQALAEAAHDAALESKKTIDEIEVTSPTGVVIATVTLRDS